METQKLLDEQLVYTNFFDQDIDPDGELQEKVEWDIASNLFYDYEDKKGKWNPLDQAVYAIRAVHRVFIYEVDGGRMPAEAALDVLPLAFEILRKWHSDLESSAYGPNEEECNEAARELTILILSYLCPTYVEKQKEE